MHRVALLLRLRRAVVLTALGALPFTLAGCSDPTGPLPEAGPPQSMEFTIGGFATQSIRVAATGDTVLFVRRDWSGPAAVDSVRVVPSAEAWRAFWTSASAAGVRRWRERYANDGVVDGTGWSLHIGLRGEDVRSQGANAYPDPAGGFHSDMTPAFRAFVGALGVLVGRDLGYGSQPQL